MTAGSIEFACPYCERVTRVPATFGGKQGKCPGCQKVIEVPAADGEEAKGFETPGAPPPVGAAPKPVGAVVDDGPKRACPYCGETIKAQAKKCKFCGEFLDAGLRGRARGHEYAGQLASVFSRFGARFIDGAIEWIPTMVLLVVGAGIADSQGGNNPVGILLVLVGLLYLLVVIAYQWYLISVQGQTIGKKMCGIRIVRQDGSPVDFVSGVILRNWVIGAIGMVPYIGPCMNLIGFLLILGNDRKCLHDHIATTIVIEA